jgi:hypothetical protein
MYIQIPEGKQLFNLIAQEDAQLMQTLTPLCGPLNPYPPTSTALN